jgi:hypothetical protein
MVKRMDERIDKRDLLRWIWVVMPEGEDLREPFLTKLGKF